MRLRQALGHIRTRSSRVGLPTFSVFGQFERDAGDSLPLLDGYRDHIKRRWRATWWPTRALLLLRESDEINASARVLTDELLESRTLPIPLHDYAEVVGRLALLP